MSVGTGSIKRAAAKAGEAKGKTPAATVKTAVKPAREKAATGAKAATKPKSAAAKKTAAKGAGTKNTATAAKVTASTIPAVSPEVVEKMNLEKNQVCHLTEDLPVYLL